MNKAVTTIKAHHSRLSYDFHHNIGTNDVIVQVYDPEGESINNAIIIREPNRVTLLFNEPPNFDMRIVVIG